MHLNETVPQGVSPAYYYESKVPIIYGTGVLFIIICVGSVVFRFYARKVAAMSYGPDDWFALTAAPFTIAVTALNFSKIPLEGGRQTIVMLNTDHSLIREWSRRIFVGAFLYNIAIAMFELSFLALYIRLFGVCHKVRRSCFIVGAAIILWLIVSEMVLLFRCHPISGFMDPTKSKCTKSFHAYRMLAGIPTIIFGFVTIAIPIRLVWFLKLNFISRIAVIGIFLLDSIDLIISVCRMVFAPHDYGLHDPLWDTVIMYYWSAAEPITGVLCCCLLTYVPLFRNFRADNQKRAGQEDCALEAAAYHRRCNSGKYLNSDSNDTLTALTATYTVSNVLVSFKGTRTLPIAVTTLPPSAANPS